MEVKRKFIFHKNVSTAVLQDEFLKLRSSHLAVVRAVGGLLHRRVLLVVSNLHTHHRVHVEAYQLPGLDHCDADLMGDISTSETLKGKQHDFPPTVS